MRRRALSPRWLLLRPGRLRFPADVSWLLRSERREMHGGHSPPRCQYCIRHGFPPAETSILYREKHSSSPRHNTISERDSHPPRHNTVSGKIPTCRTDIGIRLPRPQQRRGRGIPKIDAVTPVLGLRPELSPLDLANKSGRPLTSLVERLSPHAADPRLGYARVPDVVQLELGAPEDDVDLVPALRHVLRMERLVDVADKVHEELCRVLVVTPRERAVHEARRIVVDRRDHTAGGLAVALEVNGTCIRNRVLCVDEVEGTRKLAPLGVPDGVGPCRDAREVV